MNYEEWEVRGGRSGKSERLDVWRKRREGGYLTNQAFEYPPSAS